MENSVMLSLTDANLILTTRLRAEIQVHFARKISSAKARFAHKKVSASCQRHQHYLHLLLKCAQITQIAMLDTFAPILICSSQQTNLLQ